MSGGIAYVYDRDGDFAIHCNTERGPEAAHEKAAGLRRMLERHAHRSTRRAIWTTGTRRRSDYPWMPRDYAAVLKQQEQEQPEVTHAS